MDFANKAELIEFIKNQCGVELKNIDNFCGEDPELLYTEIPKRYIRPVLSLCHKYGIQTNEHCKDAYWIYLKN